MCGFTGFIELKAQRTAMEREATVLAMANTLYTRGPDDSGAFADSNSGYAVGFRRLAIIDLSPNGHQPMVSACGRYVIAFNGEAYNAPNLRPWLEAEGVGFRGHSDTEVVLESCARYGVMATAGKLIGMFAFALYDRETRTTHLVRDRMGIKPLYIGRVNETVFFGSQPKSFVPHPSWRGKVDRGALAAYTRFGYLPPDQCIYEGIDQLPPGHIAKISADGTIARDCYWDLRSIALDGVAQQTRPSTR